MILDQEIVISIMQTMPLSEIDNYVAEVTNQ